MEESFSLMIVIAIGIMVLIIATFLLYITAGPGMGSVDKMTAISRCDDMCMNDPIRGVVSLNGVCAYNPSYKITARVFNIKEEGELKCIDLITCSMPSARGTCRVDEITYDKEKTCEEACGLDGGNYMGTGSGTGARMTNMCAIYSTNNVNCDGFCIKGSLRFDQDMC